jgi:hypothetical protein
VGGVPEVGVEGFKLHGAGWCPGCRGWVLNEGDMGLGSALDPEPTLGSSTQKLPLTCCTLLLEVLLSAYGKL